MLKNVILLPSSVLANLFKENHGLNPQSSIILPCLGSLPQFFKLRGGDWDPTWACCWFVSAPPPLLFYFIFKWYFSFFFWEPLLPNSQSMKFMWLVPEWTHAQSTIKFKYNDPYLLHDTWSSSTLGLIKNVIL